MTRQNEWSSSSDRSLRSNNGSSESAGPGCSPASSTSAWNVSSYQWRWNQTWKPWSRKKTERYQRHCPTNVDGTRRRSAWRTVVAVARNGQHLPPQTLALDPQWCNDQRHHLDWLSSRHSRNPLIKSTSVRSPSIVSSQTALWVSKAVEADKRNK